MSENYSPGIRLHSQMAPISRAEMEALILTALQEMDDSDAGTYHATVQKLADMWVEDRSNAARDAYYDGQQAGMDAMS